MRAGRSTVVLCGFAGVFLCATGLIGYFLFKWDHPSALAIVLAQGLLYAAAAWWILRQGESLERGPALIVILGAALVARAMLLPVGPVSTDIYRYVWDGRVQAAGINPYLYMPADPALAALRDGDIHPKINRPETAVTIYPPMAQIVFLAATRFGETVTVMKAAMVAFEGLAVFALLRLLSARGLPRARIILYAWHPLPLFEFAGSGHVDAVAIGFMMVAMLAADWRRPFLAGVFLAAGAAAKYVPAVVAPALYRRWDWRMPAGFILTLALLYLPYLDAGRGVLGFLPGYVREEGIADSGIFWLALASRLIALPSWGATTYLAAAALPLLGLGFAVALRRRPDAISPAAAGLLLAAFTLAITPHYTWYFTWLVPLLCLRPSASLVWLTAASPLLYGILPSVERFGAELLLYLPFLLILAVEALRANTLPRRKEIGHERRLGTQPTA